MFTFIAWVFAENRHPIHNPTVDEDFNGNDRNDDKELSPVKKLTVWELPVKRDQCHVQPVEDDANDSKDGRKLDKAHFLPLCSKDEEEAREENEDKDFDEEPVAIGRIQ